MPLNWMEDSCAQEAMQDDGSNDHGGPSVSVVVLQKAYEQRTEEVAQTSTCHEPGVGQATVFLEVSGQDEVTHAGQAAPQTCIIANI